MGFLAALLTPALVGSLLNQGMDLFKQYQQGQITREQLQNNLQAIIAQEITKQEQARFDALKANYSSFVQLALGSRVVQVAYAYTVITQATVLVFAQVGIPAIVWFYGGTWPSSGATLDWGYLLLAGMLGLGALAYKKAK
jgi:hypothetical protein